MSRKSRVRAPPGPFKTQRETFFHFGIVGNYCFQHGIHFGHQETTHELVDFLTIALNKLQLLKKLSAFSFGIRTRTNFGVLEPAGSGNPVPPANNLSVARRGHGNYSYMSLGVLLGCARHRRIYNRYSPKVDEWTLVVVSLM